MRAFRRFLCRFFNLTLMEDYNLLLVENNNQRAHLDTMRSRLTSQDEMLGRERQEKLRLQEIIFKAHGIIQPDQTQEIPADLTPVRSGRERWSNLRGRLESDDRKRVSAETKEGRIPPFN